MGLKLGLRLSNDALRDHIELIKKELSLDDDEAIAFVLDSINSSPESEELDFSDYSKLEYKIYFDKMFRPIDGGQLKVINEYLNKHGGEYADEARRNLARQLEGEKEAR